MCGRFVLFIPLAEIAREFDIEQLTFEFGPDYNIAPSREVPLVVRDTDKRLILSRWGFVPVWAADPSIGNKMINARAETVAEKPAFKKAITSQRCIVPASGFYEWRKTEGKKQPVYIKLKSGRVMAMAGIYNTWMSPSGETVNTFAIITTQPNELVKEIHNRMPVLLHPDQYEEWLQTGKLSPAALDNIFKPYPPEELEGYDVSPKVNSPANNSPDNIEPLE
ncbi:SOS response-associated peptidase [Prosthecochloris sp.]|uniref:SOS response-associated peptidase n=1 Tax=Prosthecochloris sp. TaxID=290513 RepID=UPI002579F3F6|nr:SOS response-associated peptidase [Prosthecochloris sp.]